MKRKTFQLINIHHLIQSLFRGNELPSASGEKVYYFENSLEIIRDGFHFPGSQSLPASPIIIKQEKNSTQQKIIPLPHPRAADVNDNGWVSYPLETLPNIKDSETEKAYQYILPKTWQF